ncbi:hypothetical protein LCGC14_0893150 [marine sediment metagenome]|uniref:Uncharacterized protein n=1 Tax=marine sediment metagenome TaxID=412755 RepID=A0A0F9RHX3_9ZZZZ
MTDLLERVRLNQANLGLVGTITLPAELHHALVDEVERLRRMLPKTKDNVVAQDGTRVYRPRKPGRCDDGLVTYRVNSEEGYSYIHRWYSSRDVAEAGGDDGE